MRFFAMCYAFDHGCNLAMMVPQPGSDSQRNAKRKEFRIAYKRTKWRFCSEVRPGEMRTGGGAMSALLVYGRNSEVVRVPFSASSRGPETGLWEVDEMALHFAEDLSECI
jgi:hypothetical protein